jgi:hypothetical protein
MAASLIRFPMALYLANSFPGASPEGKNDAGSKVSSPRRRSCVHRVLQVRRKRIFGLLYSLKTSSAVEPWARESRITREKVCGANYVIPGIKFTPK